MYRIMIATSGSYYVQKPNQYGDFKMVGGFYKTLRQAEGYIAAQRGCRDKVIAYYP